MRLALVPGELELLPEHAVFEPASRSLLVADLHLGKGLSFRAQGLNVPAGSTAATLQRLARLLDRCRPAALYVLGDLLHDARAMHPGVIERLAGWRSNYPEVAVRLLVGNHDRHAGPLPAGCGVEAIGPELTLGNWTLRHDEGAHDSSGFTISGHVHPTVRIASRIDSLARPCFWLRGRGLIVPAFGAMTGGWRVQPAQGERVFISAGESVVDVTAAALGAGRQPSPGRRSRPARLSGCG